ncbi:hypothetical protein [Shinella sp. BYT-45]|uniref:hypothetical protein n=1 Tax=Shinella sp. BYT-45 TaxID=3377377 RepID=UPI0039802775
MTRGAVIVGLFLLMGGLPVLWPMPSLAAAILTAPSLLLLPAGLGLAATCGLSGRMPAGLSRLQALLVAYFTGLFLFILLFVASERFLADPPRPGVLVAAVWIVSLAGWLRMRELAGIPRKAVRSFLLVSAIAGLLVAIRYAYTISIYSDFPVTDLFQRSQFHGGAWEFARDLTLNPFVAASYIPFQQLQLGLLLRLTGADPLVAEWVWPVAMAPLQAGALFVFFSRMLAQRQARLLAFAVALAQAGLSNPTNGTVAELASITVLSLLLADCRPEEGRGKAIVLCLLALGAGIAVGLALMKMPLEGTIATAAALVLLGGVLTRHCGLLASIVLLAAVTLTFHRGALLYVVLGGTAISAYGFLVHVQDRAGEKVRRLLRGLLVAAVAIAAAMAARILLAPGGTLSDAFGLWWIFDLVLVPFAGKSLEAVSIDGDLAPGVGSRVALFELARAVSPMVVAAAVLYMSLLAIPAFRRRWGFLREEAGRQTLAQVLVLVGFAAVILTGFPFIHRASFLVTLLASAAIANIFLSTRLQAGGSRFLALVCAAYAVVIVGAAYAGASPGVKPYLQRALPVFLALGAVLAAMPFLRQGCPARRGWRTAAVLVLVVTTEVALSKAYFKPYAFRNQIPPSSGALASFDAADLSLADFIASRADGTEVLVSDPKTMTFLRARTGLYPFLSSSNLATVGVTAREELVSLLRAVVSREPASHLCRSLAATLDKGASGIYSYGSARRLLPQENGKTVLAALGYDGRLVPSYGREPNARLAAEVRIAMGQRFLIVVGRTTMDWLRDPAVLRYFPVHGPLPPAVAANLDRKFPVHRVFRDTYIAELECK